MTRRNNIQFINSIEEALQLTLLGLKYLKEQYNVEISTKPTRSPLTKPNRLPAQLQYHVTISNLTSESFDHMFNVRKVLAINSIGFDTGYGCGGYDWELDWSFRWDKSDVIEDKDKIQLLEDEFKDDIDGILDFISFYNKHKEETLESLMKEIYGTATNIL